MTTGPNFGAIARRATKAALPLALSMLGGVLGSQSAQAQEPTGIVKYYILNNDHSNVDSNSRFGADYTAEYKRAKAYYDAQNAKKAAEAAAKKAAAKPIVVDTAANRQFANRVYLAASTGIYKVYDTQGKNAALEFSNHPENNQTLMAIVKQAKDGQNLLAVGVIVDAMVDTQAYINGTTKNRPLSTNDLAVDIAAAQQRLSQKPEGERELAFLTRVYADNGNCLGPKTREALGAVLTNNRVLMAGASKQQVARPRGDN